MNSEIVKRLNDTLEKFGISKAKASRDMGYSSAILSAYTTGNYSGDLTKLEDNIVRWNRHIPASVFQSLKQQLLSRFSTLLSLHTRSTTSPLS